MKFKILLASLLLVFSTTAVHADGDLAAVLKEAAAENKKAGEMGFEWRDTGKMLKKAKEEKDAKKAMKLAKKALAQAKAAQEQAKIAKNAGPLF